MAEQAKEAPPSDGKRKRQSGKPRGTVYIVPERCKGCGICAEFCPAHVLVMSDEFNAKGYHSPAVQDPDLCSGCELCGLYCPDFAIFAVKNNRGQGKE